MLELLKFSLNLKLSRKLIKLYFINQKEAKIPKIFHEWKLTTKLMKLYLTIYLKKE